MHVRAVWLAAYVQHKCCTVQLCHGQSCILSLFGSSQTDKWLPHYVHREP